MEIKGHNDLELKKYEELYCLSKELLEKEHDRFVNIEDKTQKHFTIMVVILGFISFNIDEYLQIWQDYTDYLDISFLIILPMLAVLVFTSLFFYIKAISFGKYKSLNLNSDMFAHFKHNRYIDIIFSLSKRNAEDLEINKLLTNKKIDSAAIAFLFSKIILGSLPLIIVLYLIIKLRS